ncbi:MAG: cytosine deaminase [Rhizobiaceae bacterium]|nr:cytosine deaminase [Rhizobiaceae bacterium]
MSAFVIPVSGSYRLARARLHTSLTPGLSLDGDPDGFVLAELEIADGKIRRISPQDIIPSDAVDLAGRIVLPCFVDCHTHIDKGHIWQRSPNPDGSFPGALAANEADRTARWSSEDVSRRMDFSLRCAYAHGTSAVRTHIDSIAPQDDISWPVFMEMRERWKGRVDLQAVSLVGLEMARDRQVFSKLVQQVAAADGVLGAFLYPMPDVVELLDFVFSKATQYGLDLDFHADETLDPSATGLRQIAEAALWNNFDGRILVGHCCSLARQPEQDVLPTLDKVAKAGISVVSLPMCNLYLQDRRQDGTTPRWRGVTLLHEMKARGIPIAVASDNTRDPFYAYGDLDMLEVYRESTRILHLDHPVADWPRAASATPAEIMRLDETGILAEGGPADFIVFRGRSWTELLSRPESDRIVVRGGRAIERDLPDYSELDDLMGA